MKLIKSNPTTPGTRHQINLTKNQLSKKNSVFKNLNYLIKNYAGRSSNTRHITVWHKGGGCKKKFKKINLNLLNAKMIVLVVSYDPFRNSFISLGFDILNKKFSFFLATHSTYPGTLINSHKKKFELYFGNQTVLSSLPIGVFVHSLSKNITGEIFAKYSRAAGTFCQIIQKKHNNIQVRIPSGKFITVTEFTFATFGRVSNYKQNLTVLGKAGRNRNKGIRPHVRGIAMNPVDHPHGGRTNGGRPSTSPWGLLTKGKKTVKKNE